MPKEVVPRTGNRSVIEKKVVNVKQAKSRKYSKITLDNDNMQLSQVPAQDPKYLRCPVPVQQRELHSECSSDCSPNHKNELLEPVSSFMVISSRPMTCLSDCTLAQRCHKHK